jgi:hypothetical protein
LHDVKSISKTGAICLPESERCSSRISKRLIEVAALRRQNQLTGDFYQVAQALILCGLPYQPSTSNKITRSARLADGTRLQVTFSASLDTGLPYGSDRSVLHFLLDKAVKTQSPFVTWKTASQFLEAMGMQQGGKNRRDLRERYLRIRGLTIGVQRSSSGTSETQIMPVIKRSRLPTSIIRCVDNDWSDKEALKHPVDDLGLEIDAGFFAELVAHPVVVPVELIRATRGKPQLQDMVLFLYWRCYAARSLSVIPWRELRMQLWQADTNLPRIRSRFAAAIRALQTLWPEMRASAESRGLVVGPPAEGRCFTEAGQAARRNALSG